MDLQIGSILGNIIEMIVGLVQNGHFVSRQGLLFGPFIIKKLTDLFPSYYGKFISLFFGKYLTFEIKTEEQMKAFKEIIDLKADEKKKKKYPDFI